LAGVLLLGFTSARAETILIDFGNAAPGGTTYVDNFAGTNTGFEWNNITAVSTTVPSLVDTTNTATGISFATGPWTNGGSTGGTTGGNGSPVGIYPTVAVEDYFFFNNASGLTDTMTLTGLNNAYSYTFTWLSSKNVGFATNAGGRALTILATGSNSGSATEAAAIQATGAPNLTPTTISGIDPLAGTITLLASNNNGDFAYLNVLEIDVVATPEPSTVALAIIGGLGLFVVVLRRRQLSNI
jgi:hypothetical protein